MSLNDTMIRSLKPKPTAYKVADERGLFLLVTPAGGKLWKLKFRNGLGVEKKLALGAYPELRLKDAREARDKARSALARGVDPAEQKQSDRRAAKVNAANTFGVIAQAYIEKNRRDGKAEATVHKREWFLGLVDKAIGHRPIADIQPYEILDTARPYEAAKSHAKSHRSRNIACESQHCRRSCWPRP